MNSSSHEVEFCGRALGKHRRICAFFNSVAEQHWVLVSLIRDGLDRGHPGVIIGGVLQENPLFVPPDQFLLELSERRRKHSVIAM